jgi:hypothetical protein
MSYPIVIYTNLFTLPNKSISINRYVDMYFVWLYNILKYAKLTPYDYCVTFIDEKTLEYIEKSQVYQLFKTQIPNFTSIPYRQPVDIKEGILQRYNITKLLEVTSQIAYLNPLYIHLDIDVLIVNDIRQLFNSENQSLNKTTIYIKTEGSSILDGCYYGELITEDEKRILKDKRLEHMPGFSAAIYGWRNSHNIHTFFDLILERASGNEKELYTVEQPFYNAAVFNYLFHETGVFNFSILDTKKIGHNTIGAHTSPDTVLINFCGIPGDDMFHWDKLLLQLFLQGLTAS